MKARGPDNGKFKHGHNGASGKSPTYISWDMMLHRCSNPKYGAYKFYGGRGIRVCKRWRVFHNFLADMGERPVGTSLDRIKTNGNYERSNCRWATPSQQHRNMRSNIWIETDGKRLILADWARLLRVNRETLRHRYKVGLWP